MRHACASLWIEEGLNAKRIQALMGHSSIQVTFDTYGHLFPGRGKDASERFEKSMEIARKKAEADVSNPLANREQTTENPNVVRGN